MELNRIYNENCLDLVKRMPDNYIDCVVTSPPYYGLRDYGSDVQFGMEETPEMFVQNLVELFREIRRALKPTGTLWLNLGDSYAGNNSQASNNGRAGLGNPRERIINRISDGLKSKDIIGIPWMVAFALRADGWYLRQDIIWHKPNPMPESVTDRCTKAHEYIFLLSKSQKYYYDAEAVKEKSISVDIRPSALKRSRAFGYDTKDKLIKGYSDNPNEVNRCDIAPTDRNKRSVWSVTTKPFKDAHFATFPEDLIIPCILAGCPADGVVYDPFMGAGTTAKVSLRLGRNYIGSELNPAYIAIAEKRIGEFVKSYGTADASKAIPGQQINLF